MTDDRWERLLEQQLEMNPRTWAALEERGVNTRTLLLIEYAFTAPTKKAAQGLIKALQAQTNFTTELLAQGTILKRHWRVTGQTKPAAASVEMLNDWVTFMVGLGSKNGECRFDGWGVRVPEATPESGPMAQLRDSFAAQRRNGHHDNTLLIDDEALGE